MIDVTTKSKSIISSSVVKEEFDCVQGHVSFRQINWYIMEEFIK